MPEYSEEILGKIEALRALPAGERKPAEVTAFYWPAPDFVKVYASVAYDELPDYPNLRAALAAKFGAPTELLVKLLPEGRSPFSDLPRSASVSDDNVDFEVSDIDGEFSRMVAAHGEGVRAEVFGYWPAIDLLLSLWRGSLGAPKEMGGASVKVSASTGFKSPQLIIPRRPRATSCTFIFGGLFSSQEEVDYHKGCPHNANLTEEERAGAPRIGVPGVFDCPRRNREDCFARLTEPDSDTHTYRFWPGFETRADPIPNNQTKGPNLMARAVGNDSILNEPLRVIAGERLIKLPAPIKFRAETNTNHPEKGFGAAVFADLEGPMDALWEFRLNNVLVGLEHLNIRLGEGGQRPTNFSPNENSYSWTATSFGRIQGNFGGATAASFSGSIRGRGLRDTRVYTSPGVFLEAYTTNRALWLLRALCDPRWGYGNDYSKYNIASVLDAADWCDESVAMHDPLGNLFAGTRSSFNAELTGRTTQETIQNICTTGRLGLPFEFNGEEVFAPLRKEALGDDIPVFTDEGPEPNIVSERGKSTLRWAPLSDKTLTNQWKVNYDDASNGFADTQLIFGDQMQQLRAGRAFGDRSIKVLDKSQPAFGITNFSEAARFGVLLLYLGPLDAGGIANPFEVKFTTWYAHALRARMYGLVRVLNAKLQETMLIHFARLGFPWFVGLPYEYFRVKKIDRKGDLKVEITAQVYPQDFYDLIEDVEQEPPTIAGPPERNPGGRPDEQPFHVGFGDIGFGNDKVHFRLNPFAIE